MEINATEILTLSASSPLPVPVGREPKGLDNGVDDKENEIFGLSPTSLSGTSPIREPIVPYQALPVTAAIITEHLTDALPVMEPTEMTHEVSLAQHAPFSKICYIFAASQSF